MYTLQSLLLFSQYLHFLQQLYPGTGTPVYALPAAYEGSLRRCSPNLTPSTTVIFEPGAASNADNIFASSQRPCPGSYQSRPFPLPNACLSKLTSANATL